MSPREPRNDAADQQPSHGRRGEELLLSALATGGPVEQAAAAAGLSVRTVYRRLNEPSFRSRLTAARDELIVSALGELAAVAAEAVATLQRLLSSPDERVQLGAARTLLDQTLRLREAVLLEQRIARLEREQSQRQRGRR